MSLTGAYDDDNVFARIVRGELPSVKVFEDDVTLAIMDAFPQAEGHVLVIHKASKARNLLDVEPQALSELTATVQRMARAMTAALDPDGLLLTQFNGAPAGQTVFHLHFHLIPRREGEALARHGGGMAPADQLQAVAAKIRAAL
ncbi:HIT family protein [Brevundimonas sp. 2R-24]|uniref:HIT family protein n=1 Tax=Peiella sedimenti TaxID=3061083 RepID=A0ABT8SJB1_9CAUL|nr:HIT family protein [Caulobacteraceae bacterium XZ-24]